MSRTAARARPAAAVLPGVNTLVRLTVGSTADPDDDPVATNVPSRVEDVTPADPRAKGSRTQLFVAVPHYPGDVSVPRPGTACTVTWVNSDGLYDLPAGFVERVVVGPVVRAWRVEVTGRAARAQRRRYVRVAWTGTVLVDVIPVVRLGPHAGPVDGAGPPVAGSADPPGAVDGADAADRADAAGVEPVEDPERDTVHGTILDLSEGGVRCTLPSPPLRSGQPVRVHLDVEDERLIMDGTVVRVKMVTPKPGAHPVCETGIAFTEPDIHGDLLRRAVFGEQLRARRSGTE